MVLGCEIMKKLSYISIGLIVGLLIGLTSTAYAQDVTAAFSKFIFKVNGQEKPLDADPLVYQGTTYLPVRTVANLLGYDVTYKADSKTIELIQPSPTVQPINNATGGATVNDPTTTGISIEGISSKIETVKLAISFDQAAISGGFVTTDDAKAKVDKRIADNEQLLKQLEELKATLESQPTPTP
jgi:hypothetical protein